MVILRVGIFIYEGAEEMDFVGVHEVLGVAKRTRPGLGIDVKLYAPSPSVKCANGMQLIPDAVGYDLSDRDLLVIPGGRGKAEAAKDPRLLDLIRDFASSRYVASVCTGALVLREAGILTGKKVSTHHESRHLLGEVAIVVKDRVVEDGNLITAGGVTASIDLGLQILRRFFGAGLADEVAARIEYPPNVVA